MENKNQKTLLLVEDDPMIAITEEMSLEKYGYKVIIANTGEKAVEFFDKLSGVDLILMDINLGNGIDGTQAAEKILKDHDIPIVFLSSHIEKEIVEKSEKITSYGYVVKNSGITVLDASIKMAFKLFAANKKMEITKNKLEATLDALPDLLFEIGLDGFFYDYHSPLTGLLYKPPEDIIGKKVSDILPSSSAYIIMDAIKEAHEQGYSTGKQFEITLPSGTICFEISVSHKRNSDDNPLFIVLSRDITKHLRTEENLRTHKVELKMQNDEFRCIQNDLEVSLAKYYDLFNLAPVSYFILNEQGLILETNQTAEIMLGMPRNELVMQSITKIIIKEDQDIYYLHNKQIVKTGKSQTFELRIHHCDGSPIRVQMAASAAKDEIGKPDYHIEMIALIKNIQIENTMGQV